MTFASPRNSHCCCQILHLNLVLFPQDYFNDMCFPEHGEEKRLAQIRVNSPKAQWKCGSQNSIETPTTQGHDAVFSMSITSHEQFHLYLRVIQFLRHTKKGQELPLPQIKSLIRLGLDSNFTTAQGSSSFSTLILKMNRGKISTPSSLRTSSNNMRYGDSHPPRYPRKIEDPVNGILSATSQKLSFKMRNCG